MRNLTDQEMWTRGYESRDEPIDLVFDWRNHCNYVLAEKIDGVGLDSKDVLEIGAGDSQWLPYLAAKHPTSQFGGLDYSRAGCDQLFRRISRASEGPAIDVYHQDMFQSKSDLHGRFDVVLSFGVVEHFTDLAHALSAKRRFLRREGMMFTLIPNMAGLIGTLARIFNPAVYQMHNPHDLDSFVAGHEHAGMSVVSSGYLGSTNFGVLASCFEEARGVSWSTYVFLTRLSKAVGYVEGKVGRLPTSKLFSPYIYAISRPL